MTSSSHIRIKPDFRLRSALRKPGGLTIDEALARANERLETVRESSMVALDEKIAALGTQAGAGCTTGDLYFLASEIFGIAGSFGQKGVVLAAKSLCDLLAVEKADREVMEEKPTARVLAAVAVHVDALRALRVPEMAANEAGCRALIDGLKRVVSHTQTTAAKSEPAG